MNGQCFVPGAAATETLHGPDWRQVCYKCTLTQLFVQKIPSVCGATDAHFVIQRTADQNRVTGIFHLFSQQTCRPRRSAMMSAVTLTDAHAH